jgi:predicted RNase H-like nuclease (RuvC/YqgF family)
LQALQARLDSAERQVSQDAAHAATLQAKVNDLTESLMERDRTIDEQQELLAHDRDIRELMGARDLYIAEVYDVARTGVTQKPFRRVFYTKVETSAALLSRAGGIRGERRRHPMELHTIGIDLGKTVFHLVGLDLRGEVVVATRSFHVRGFCISRRPDTVARRGVSPHFVTLALLPVELSSNDGIVRANYLR